MYRVNKLKSNWVLPVSKLSHILTFIVRDDSVIIVCLSKLTHTHTHRETQLLSYHSYEAKAPAHDSLNFRRKKATERTQNKTLWSHSIVLHRSLLPASAVVKVIRMCVCVLVSRSCIQRYLRMCLTGAFCLCNEFVL